jgi:ERCC4-related helicase
LLDPDEWWLHVSANGAEGIVGEVVEQVAATRAAMSKAEEKLRPWVLRHVKDARLPTARDIDRRRILPGAAILDPSNGAVGLEIGSDVLLPFLLAGRAQALLAASRKGRALFAEGLASSFEAYVETRSRKLELDEDAIELDVKDAPELKWYLGHLDRALPREERGAWEAHPKVHATAKRVVDLWKRGDKALVFCHYRETGRALRRHISALLNEEIARLAAAQLGREPGPDTTDELDRIADRFFESDGPLRRAVTESIGRIVERFPAIEREHGNVIIDVIRRFLRTPSFLVRHFDLTAADHAAAFAESIERTDIGGLSLRERIEHFCRFLEQCIPAERHAYLEALGSIQTGRQSSREVAATFDRSEIAGESERVVLLPNVRLANGAVSHETRRKLLLAFNTPLFPEILIASSVLAEGVDLHLNCRHVIHHDLCWNPSTLEQRTGRVDRIGSKAERVRASIDVFLPYVAATQDEKMYRVVKDRERWFQIVMGERYEVDEAATERRAERIALPEQVRRQLSLKLDIAR